MKFFLLQMVDGETGIYINLVVVHVGGAKKYITATATILLQLMVAVLALEMRKKNMIAKL